MKGEKCLSTNPLTLMQEYCPGALSSVGGVVVGGANNLVIIDACSYLPKHHHVQLNGCQRVGLIPSGPIVLPGEEQVALTRTSAAPLEEPIQEVVRRRALIPQWGWFAGPLLVLDRDEFPQLLTTSKVPLFSWGHVGKLDVGE